MRSESIIIPISNTMKGKEDLIHPPSPGFQLALLSRSFIGIEVSFSILTPCVCIFDWFAPGRKQMVTQKCITAACCDCLQVGLYQVLRRGPHLDFEVLQWSKLVENRSTQMR